MFPPKLLYDHGSFILGGEGTAARKQPSSRLCASLYDNFFKAKRLKIKSSILKI